MPFHIVDYSGAARVLAAPAIGGRHEYVQVAMQSCGHCCDMLGKLHDMEEDSRTVWVLPLDVLRDKGLDIPQDDPHLTPLFQIVQQQGVPILVGVGKDFRVLGNAADVVERIREHESQAQAKPTPRTRNPPRSGSGSGSLSSSSGSGSSTSSLASSRTPKLSSVPTTPTPASTPTPTPALESPFLNLNGEMSGLSSSSGSSSSSVSGSSGSSGSGSGRRKETPTPGANFNAGPMSFGGCGCDNDDDSRGAKGVRIPVFGGVPYRREEDKEERRSAQALKAKSYMPSMQSRDPWSWKP